MTPPLPRIKNCPGISPIAAHLNNSTIPIQKPVSSGGSEMLASQVLKFYKLIPF